MSGQHAEAIAPLHPADKRKAAIPKKRLCSRCKTQSSAVLLQSASFCHDCFQANFEGKVHHYIEQSRLCTYLHRNESEAPTSSSSSSFSAALLPASSSSSFSAREGTSAPVSYPCRGRVAVAFSGGPASRALLHAAKKRLAPRCQDDRRRNKMQEVYAIDVLYVDQSAVIAGADNQTENVRSIVDEEEGGKEEGLYFWPLKLEDVFADGKGAVCTAESAASRMMADNTHSIKDCRTALQNLFHSIQPSNTPRGMLANARSRAEDLVALLTAHLLRREAIRMGASCLLTGETSTRKAIRIIDAVGKGRGHKLSMEEGSIRWNGLFLIQPLKEVTSKEVMLFSRARRLRSISPLDYVSAQLLLPADRGRNSDGSNGDKASMGRLTESLIHLLEGNVASTISTINKVGDKLVFADDMASHGYEEGLKESRRADEGLDTNASSSHAFHQIGPSVPLRHHRKKQAEQNGTASQLAHMSLSSKPSPGSPGDRSLAGLGLGRNGSALLIAARKMVPYDGALACPLCQMPSQRGLHAWKRGLTVSSASSEKSAGASHPLTSATAPPIDLTELLCYACSIILDTPEGVARDATMVLPSFVLHGAQKRLQDLNRGLSEMDPADADEDEVTAHAITSSSNGLASVTTSKILHEKSASTQKLDRAQMKRHLNGFLLADEEEPGSSTNEKTGRPPAERKQTDW